MKCQKCEWENEEDAKFCANCGSPLEALKKKKSMHTVKRKKTVYVAAGIIIILTIAGITENLMAIRSAEKAEIAAKQAQEQAKKETEESYAKLMEEGDALLSSDKNQAAAKYLGAIELMNHREEAYMKLLKVYIETQDISASQDLILQIEKNITEQSKDLQTMIENEKQKKWYLTGATVSIYDLSEDNNQTSHLQPEDMDPVCTKTYDCYYKYDERGRLIETNAGPLTSVYAKNDGSYRDTSGNARLDKDIFTARYGEDKDYILESLYSYPVHMDGNNTFLFEYNDDGTVTETVMREGRSNEKHRYVFNRKLLTSYQLLDYDTDEVQNSYTDIKYHDDYVSYSYTSYEFFDTRSGTGHWEESYGTDGKLNNYMIELGVSGTLKFNFYYEDSADESGNILKRTLKFDVKQAEIVGRKHDGTYYEWETLKTGVLSKIVEYKYSYCRPDEIAALN